MWGRWLGHAKARRALRTVVVLAAAMAALAGSAQPAPGQRDLVLDVLTYNTALLPRVAASTRQAERAARMAPHLLGYDVLVLQELFVDGWREPLLAELAETYPYRTDVVGRDGARLMPWREDGGIVILSRWPIALEAQRTFDTTCSGTDCMADKGVAYAAIRLGDRTVHVFGTHAQSVYGGGAPAVRAAQFALMRAFVDEQGIPPDETVVLAGDFNVDAYSPELDVLLASLRAVRPTTVGAGRFTWDPAENDWAGGRRPQWLDYVLVAADHAAPTSSWNRVVTLRDDDMDLSDHHAVWGRLVWSADADAPDADGPDARPPAPAAP